MELSRDPILYSSEEIFSILKSEKLISLYKSRSISSVIVFGSIVTEDFEEYSDVDIAIISKEKISLSLLMEFEDELKGILKREIDILDLNSENIDLNMQVSILDNGIVVYNDNLDLYTKMYNDVDNRYKDNETYRYFRERDVIYDE